MCVSSCAPHVTPGCNPNVCCLAAMVSMHGYLCIQEHRPAHAWPSNPIRFKISICDGSSQELFAARDKDCCQELRHSANMLPYSVPSDPAACPEWNRKPAGWRALQRVLHSPGEPDQHAGRLGAFWLQCVLQPLLRFAGRVELCNPPAANDQMLCLLPGVLHMESTRNTAKPGHAGLPCHMHSWLKCKAHWIKQAPR